jgi:hypothetical protein
MIAPLGAASTSLQIGGDLGRTLHGPHACCGLRLRCRGEPKLRRELASSTSAVRDDAALNGARIP